MNLRLEFRIFPNVLESKSQLCPWILSAWIVSRKEIASTIDSFVFFYETRDNRILNINGAP